MFLSQEMDINLYQNYTKMYKCKILYKIRNIKQIIFSKYATNQSENNNIPEKPEKFTFAPIIT